MKRLYLLMLVIYLAFAGSKSAANIKTTVWFDNFNDGDHSGWEIIGHNWQSDFTTWTGNASVINDELWIYGTYPNNFTVAEYPSSVTHGTWSFDFYSKIGNNIIVFASTTNVTSSSFIPKVGLYYALSLYGTGFELMKSVETRRTVLGYYFPSSGNISNRWQHIDITKDLSDRILIYINGTLRFNVIDDTITTSYHFQLLSDNVAGLDNVTVSDTVDITTTTTATPTTGYELVTAFVVLAVFVGYFRKRRM